MPKVMFIVPYPLKRAPSQRFRVELFEPILNEANIDYRIFPFMDEATWQVIYKNGSTLQKVFGILKSYANRFLTVFSASKFDYVFIHREAAPIGPPIFEWVLAKLFRKKIIYDFDDAIWIPNTSAVNKIAASVKCFWKVRYICKWAYKVTPGNQFLANYASQFNSNIVQIPTCVDTVHKHNKVKAHTENTPVLGWTGSHSTLFYLDDIVPLIKELQEEQDFSFLVIADKKPTLDLKNWTFIPWNAVTEQDDLLKMDVGIMPLRADAWSEGKCGFKLIQYLSSGIPAIADPIGVNKDIIEDGVNGFICNNKQEWKRSIQLLMSNRDMRKSLGEKGRAKIVEEYSILSQHNKFLNLFT